MIPRAVDQVFQVAEELKSKGWEYTLEGQVLEVVRISLCPRYGIHDSAQYNETINDLLRKGGFDKKKHEIRSSTKKDVSQTS